MADVKGAGEVQVRGRYNTTPPVLTDGLTNELQLDANGNLRVNVMVGGGTSTGAIIGTADGVTLTAVVRAVNSEPALIVHDKVIRDILDELLLTTKQALEAGGIDFTNGNSDTQFQPGDGTYKAISAVGTNADVVTNGYSNLTGYYFFNSSGSTKYVRLFDLPRAPVLGSDKPKLVYPIPAGGAANIKDGLGVLFSQGMSIAITGASPDLDATAVALGDVIANVFYSNNGTPGGYSTYKVVSLATTNLDVVSTQRCNLNGYYLFNTSGATKYVKLYDLNRAPVLANDKPKITFALPSGSGANIMDETGELFSQGIAIAITGGFADTDATAVALGDVIANVYYS